MNGKNKQNYLIIKCQQIFIYVADEMVIRRRFVSYNYIKVAILATLCHHSCYPLHMLNSTCVKNQNAAFHRESFETICKLLDSQTNGFNCTCFQIDACESRMTKLNQASSQRIKLMVKFQSSEYSKISYSFKQNINYSRVHN